MTALHRLGMFNLIIFLGIILITPHEWYFLILTAAQLIYVPLILGNFIDKHSFNMLTMVACISVVFLQITDYTIIDSVLAFVYFSFTIVVAFIGIKRFLNRGFVHVEEVLIDVAMIFLAIGGMWFFAYEANINTGFTPLLTWLTAIHFHYSAFLLPIFAGLLGRINQPKGYHLVAIALIIAPIFVALGITFSTTLEIVSVIIYIFGIYGLIWFSFRIDFKNIWEKWLWRLTFFTLGITILFSLLYAYGNFAHQTMVTIDFMLKFHGLMNGLLFAGFGVVAATVFFPSPQYKKPDFPVSPLRGRLRIGETFIKDKTDHVRAYRGLVDHMEVYGLELAPTIIDFYENTINYRLFAQVQWYLWFKPFALVYRLFSRMLQQLNLPLSSGTVEMTGDIVPIKEELDHRKNVRGWVRKINRDTTFVALYSEHKTDNQTYMNIALPLPWSTMIGVLELSKEDEQLILSSQNTGIYLAFKEHVMRLPINERFEVKEIKPGELKAKHQMWIFKIPFLCINYQIKKKD